MNKIRKNLTMFLIICSFIFLNLNCKSSKMVLKIKIPKTKSYLQLWERESWSIGYGKEYKTWVNIKTGNFEKKYIIDEHYIYYRNIRVFYSEEDAQIRVETNGINTPSHSIAIYNISTKKILIKSEKTVFKKRGWVLLKECNYRGDAAQ